MPRHARAAELSARRHEHVAPDGEECRHDDDPDRAEEAVADRHEAEVAHDGNQGRWRPLDERRGRELRRERRAIERVQRWRVREPPGQLHERYDACEDASPDVFHVTDTTSVIRMESQPNWNKLSESIADAAAACPVNVIKYEIKK